MHLEKIVADRAYSEALGELFQESPMWWVDWGKNGIVLSQLDTGYERALKRIGPAIFSEMALEILPSEIPLKAKGRYYKLQISLGYPGYIVSYPLDYGDGGIYHTKDLKLANALCAMILKIKKAGVKLMWGY